MLVSFFVPVETKSRSAQPVTEEASLALIFLVFFSFHVSLFQTFKISTLAFFFFSNVNVANDNFDLNYSEVSLAVNCVHMQWPLVCTHTANGFDLFSHFAAFFRYLR